MSSKRRPTPITDKVPRGWHTRLELEDAWGLASARTRELIGAAVRNGMAEHRTFRILTPTRGVYPVTHYRFKERRKAKS